MKNKTVTLIVVIILIVGAIVYLEQSKVSPRAIGSKVSVNVSDSEIVRQKALNYPKAIELVSPDGYINADNFTLSDYIGKKVILVDFWTYSCINCLRTLPYLNYWYDKYNDSGLLIIGVHTPEFDFEKNYDNVKMATEKYDIKYPVVQDNEQQTWSAYSNQYWPHEYLIDIDGFVVHDSIGEGGYSETEQEIQKLLVEREQRLGINNTIEGGITNPNISIDFNEIQTPEIYLGYGFYRGQMGNSELYSPESVLTYKLPDKIDINKFYLSGDWLNNKDNVQAAGNSQITLDYSSKQINLVAGSDKPVSIAVYIDNNFIQNITVLNYQLYTLYDSDSYGEHKLKLVAPSGLKAYTFTFG